MPNLREQYLNTDTPIAEEPITESSSLRDQYLNSQSAAEAAAERTRSSVIGHQGNSTEELIKGFGKGALDVGNTIGQGVEFLDQLINSDAKVNFDTGKVEVSGSGVERKKALDKYIEEQNKDTEDRGTMFNVGRVGGQIAATAPFGMASKSLSNRLKESYNISKTTKFVNLNPSATKNTLDVLKESGYTPEQIQTELTRLGPKATIADLDEAFLAESEALAKSGGAATSLMKGRYAARANEANNEAMHLFEQKLGGKPDLDIAKQQIIEDAQNAVKGDYTKAYASNQPLNTQPIIDEI